jgi:hypothetical protein
MTRYTVLKVLNTRIKYINIEIEKIMQKKYNKEPGCSLANNSRIDSNNISNDNSAGIRTTSLTYNDIWIRTVHQM